MTVFRSAKICSLIYYEKNSTVRLPLAADVRSVVFFGKNESADCRFPAAEGLFVGIGKMFRIICLFLGKKGIDEIRQEWYNKDRIF